MPHLPHCRRLYTRCYARRGCLLTSRHTLFLETACPDVASAGPPDSTTPSPNALACGSTHQMASPGRGCPHITQRSCVAYLSKCYHVECGAATSGSTHNRPFIDPTRQKSGLSSNTMEIYMIPDVNNRLNGDHTLPSGG